MVVMRDQRYPVEGGSLSYDFFRPDGEGPWPIVVFLHGGGWISGDKTMYRDEALWLAPQGYACACIEYRLAPLYPFPVPVADGQAFLRFVRENASALAVDPGRVTVMGNSAGAHMALMLAMCPNRLDSFDGLAERANAVVSVCGITDLTHPGDAEFTMAMAFLEQFMNGPYEGSEEAWSQASPLTYVDHAQGRFLVLHGTADDVVPFSQSQRLVDGLESQGVPVRFVPLEGEGHSFTWPAWDRVRREVVAFLAEPAVVG